MFVSCICFGLQKCSAWNIGELDTISAAAHANRTHNCIPALPCWSQASSFDSVAFTVLALLDLVLQFYRLSSGRFLFLASWFYWAANFVTPRPALVPENCSKSIWCHRHSHETSELTACESFLFRNAWRIFSNALWAFQTEKPARPLLIPHICATPPLFKEPSLISWLPRGTDVGCPIVVPSSDDAHGLARNESTHDSLASRLEPARADGHEAFLGSRSDMT